MSNKLRLQANNTNLQELINKANALPDAGGSSGGGRVETCTVTLNVVGSLNVDISFICLEPDGCLGINQRAIVGTPWGSTTIVENVVQKHNIPIIGDYVITSIESEDNSSYYDRATIYIGTSDTTITIG